MTTQLTWQAIPSELQSLRKPSREDAIERMERLNGTWGIRKSSLFEDTSVGQRCANGEYGTGDFCKDAKAKHDASRERNIEASLEALTKQYDKDLQRKARIEADNAEVLAAETATLRQRFLEQPGSTPEEFEKALPELLAERRRRAALDGQSLVERMVDQMRPNVSF